MFTRSMKVDLVWGMIGGVITVIICAFFLNCNPAKPVNSGIDADAAPIAVLLEAGTEVVTGSCTLLEGITQNATVISICATIEEIAAVVGYISSFLRHGKEDFDAGTCTVIPYSKLCATKAEVGQGIGMLIIKRQLRFQLDGGR